MNWNILFCIKLIAWLDIESLFGDVFLAFDKKTYFAISFIQTIMTKTGFIPVSSTLYGGWVYFNLMNGSGGIGK